MVFLVLSLFIAKVFATATFPDLHFYLYSYYVVKLLLQRHLRRACACKVVHVTITFCKIRQYRALIHTAVHNQDWPSVSMSLHIATAEQLRSRPSLDLSRKEHNQSVSGSA